MKLVLKIIAGIVLAIAIGVLFGYHTWKTNQTAEYTGSYFTLGEDGTTIYIPEKKIEEYIIKEE